MSTGVATFRYVQKISDLTDVTIATTPTNGQVLKYENGVWVPGTDQAGQLPSVGQLTNTNAVTDAPTADRHALVWNTGANEWISEQVDYNNLANPPVIPTLTTIGVNNNNVNISADTASANQILKYVGAEWVNSQVEYSEILNPPVIPPPANPIGFHALGAGQTNVNANADTAGGDTQVLKWDDGAGDWKKAQVQYSEINGIPTIPVIPAPSYGLLKLEGNVVTSGIPDVGNVASYQSNAGIWARESTGEFSNGTQSDQILWTGEIGTVIKFDLSVACFTDTVDKTLEWAVFRDTQITPSTPWVVNYSKNDNNSPEGASANSGFFVANGTSHQFRVGFRNAEGVNQPGVFVTLRDSTLAMTIVR